MEEELTRLAQSYPDPARGLRALLLVRYQEIAASRSRRWEWPEIAAALGKPGLGKAIASSFARLQRRVAAGEIVPPPAGKPVPAPPRPSPASKAGISAPAAKGDDSKPSQPSTIKRLTL